MFFWPNPLLLHFTVFSFSLTVPNSRKATRDFASVLAMGASSYILYQSNSEGANFLNTWWKHPINTRNKSNNNTLNNYSSVTTSLLCRLSTTGPTQGVIILRIPIFFISWFGIPFVRLFRLSALQPHCVHARCSRKESRLQKHCSRYQYGHCWLFLSTNSQPEDEDFEGFLWWILQFIILIQDLSIRAARAILPTDVQSQLLTWLPVRLVVAPGLNKYSSTRPKEKYVDITNKPHQVPSSPTLQYLQISLTAQKNIQPTLTNRFLPWEIQRKTKAQDRWLIDWLTAYIDKPSSVANSSPFWIHKRTVPSASCQQVLRHITFYTNLFRSNSTVTEHLRPTPTSASRNNFHQHLSHPSDTSNSPSTDKLQRNCCRRSLPRIRTTPKLINHAVLPQASLFFAEEEETRFRLPSVATRRRQDQIYNLY